MLRCIVTKGMCCVSRDSQCVALVKPCVVLLPKSSRLRCSSVYERRMRSICSQVAQRVALRCCIVGWQTMGYSVLQKGDLVLCCS